VVVSLFKGPAATNAVDERCDHEAAGDSGQCAGTLQPGPSKSHAIPLVRPRSPFVNILRADLAAVDQVFLFDRNPSSLSRIRRCDGWATLLTLRKRYAFVRSYLWQHTAGPL
jgi:hypothetical protein